MELSSTTLLQGGKYRIEKVLGQGGFGITYLATQVVLNRKVAIKEFFMKEYCNRDAETSHVSIPSEGSKELVARFRQKFIKEAQTIAGLNHPHIIRIHDVFEENDTAYYVMEYHDNGSLSELVKQRGALPEAEALRYIREVADALAYIHEHQMNHLDVKPGNVLLDEKGRSVLIDFGLSKRYDESGQQTSTTPVGISHGYAPMEQYKQGGVGTFSPATDIYSLGATFYKLLTGKTPPDASDVFTDGLPALPTSISSSVSHAIAQAMSPNKKDRPQSVAAFLALLDKEPMVIDDDPTVFEIDPKPTPTPKPQPEPKPQPTPAPIPQLTPVPVSSSLKKWRIPLAVCAIVVLGVLFFIVGKPGVSPEKQEAMKRYKEIQNRLFAFTDSVTGLMGCVNYLGDTVITAKYEAVDPFGDNWVIAMRGAKLGLLDNSEKILIPIEYENCFAFYGELNYCILKKNGKYGVMNFQGEILLPFKYDMIFNEEKKEHVFMAQIGEKWGLIDCSKGKEILPCEYEMIRLGYIREWTLAGYEYNELTNHLIAVKNNGRWGFVDMSGKLVIPFKYEDGEYEDNIFYKDAAVVIQNGLYGLINTSGNVVAPFEYEKIFSMYDEPFFRATNNKTKKSVLLSNDGRVLTKEYDWIAPYTLPSEDSICSFRNGKFEGLLNFYTGKEIVPADKYSSIDRRHNGGYKCDKGVYRVCKDNKYGFIDSNGTEIIECQFEAAYAFTNGFAQVKRNGKWGYVSVEKNGSSIGCIYEDCYPFDNDYLAVVQYEGKQGCINTLGKIVIPCKYRHIEKADSDGLRKVWGGLSEKDIYGNTETLYGYIDSKGNEVIPCKYTDTQVRQERMRLGVKMLKEKIESDDF